MKYGTVAVQLDRSTISFYVYQFMVFAKLSVNDGNVKNLFVWKGRRAVEDDGDDNHYH